VPTTKELKEIYLSINQENEYKSVLFISRFLKREYYLLDEDGFSISIYYGDGNAAAFYENR
jgi:hypothetical protein